MHIILILLIAGSIFALFFHSILPKPWLACLSTSGMVILLMKFMFGAHFGEFPDPEFWKAALFFGVLGYVIAFVVGLVTKNKNST